MIPLSLTSLGRFAPTTALPCASLHSCTTRRSTCLTRLRGWSRTLQKWNRPLQLFPLPLPCLPCPFTMTCSDTLPIFYVSVLPKTDKQLTANLHTEKLSWKDGIDQLTSMIWHDRERWSLTRWPSSRPSWPWRQRKSSRSCRKKSTPRRRSWQQHHGRQMDDHT